MPGPCSTSSYFPYFLLITNLNKEISMKFRHDSCAFVYCKFILKSDDLKKKLKYTATRTLGAYGPLVLEYGDCFFVVVFFVSLSFLSFFCLFSLLVLSVFFLSFLSFCLLFFCCLFCLFFLLFFLLF